MAKTSHDKCHRNEDALTIYLTFLLVEQSILTLKAPITTAADDIFFNIFPNFRKK